MKYVVLPPSIMMVLPCLIPVSQIIKSLLLKPFFKKNPKSDVTREIFNTFRKEGFKIGAYFSKPDWHSDDYWWSYFPPKDRNVNYDPKNIRKDGRVLKIHLQSAERNYFQLWES